MHWLDWFVLVSVLGLIVGYGIFKTRHIGSAHDFLAGSKQTPWWMVGLSIMATQASAITFLSTPGQAYDDGMRFVQFYFGLPIAMVLLCIFVLPRYYEMQVYTAYEYLDKRFGRPTRTLTASLFLIQRGMAAGITIYAPAIILASILDVSLTFNILLIGSLVIIYTISGGTEAVSQTQKQQMLVIMIGMIVALFVAIYSLPEGVGFTDAMHLAGQMGKLDLITVKFDLADRYNLISALLGGTFLFLSYFGTDQSQVQRYLHAKNLTESRLGLLMNGLVKVPMQFMILLTGVMVFVLFQYYQPPLHFNPETELAIKESAYSDDYASLQQTYTQNFIEKKSAINDWQHTRDIDPVLQKHVQQVELRTQAKELIAKYNNDHQTSHTIESNDKDYVFLYFILHFLPIGLIGLVIAVIFSAGMSSTAAELNALATTTEIDIIRPLFYASNSAGTTLLTSRLCTLFWGGLAIGFALFASLFENLIQAVNILGSIFYGTILGIFFVAFFMKKINGKVVFWTALVTQLCVIIVFYLDHIGRIQIAYLWLNALGCMMVILLSATLQSLLGHKR